MTDAARFAAAIAPELDRLRLGIMKQSAPRVAAVAQAHDISTDTLGVAAYLRNTYPDRPFARAGLLAVFTYQSTDKPSAGLDDLTSRGALEVLEGGRLRLTASGQELLRDVVTVGDTATGELWAGNDAVVARALPLTGRALASVPLEQGLTFPVLAPAPGCSAWLSPAGVLGEQLSGLRFHRFDAHIAAWRSAGLSVDEIKALEPGERRDAIEADTDARAGVPYEALTPDERAELLACLSALPG